MRATSENSVVVTMASAAEATIALLLARWRVTLSKNDTCSKMAALWPGLQGPRNSYPQDAKLLRLCTLRQFEPA